MIQFSTAQQAIDLLTRAVQERGEDYIYKPVRHPQDELGGTSCMYVHPDNTPGCLVGLALHRAGVTLDELRQHEDQPATIAVHEIGIAKDTSEFAVALFAAQTTQDSGRSWGEALAEARKYAASESTVKVPEFALASVDA